MEEPIEEDSSASTMTVPDTDIDIVTRGGRNSSELAQDAFLNGIAQVLDQ